MNIGEAQRTQFQDEGYFVLPNAIDPDTLRVLRSECDRFINLINREMDAAGVDSQGLNHRDSRYFIARRHHESPVLPGFLHSPLMATICRATLGETAYLFWEQFVVKCGNGGMQFGWHQDSGYVGHDHRPYLSCWCALDDMTEENGTVYLLPFSRAGTRERQDHRRQPGSNDLIGYHGDDPGVPVVAPAGSIAVFSSVSFHRSGENRSPGIRRVYLAQYSAEPILKRDGTGLWGLAEPVLAGGKCVPSRLAGPTPGSPVRGD
jgi:ectoine hydroxylase-related dioxygenase (phytanoyl-CoA dioxygenase family)